MALATRFLLSKEEVGQAGQGRVGGKAQGLARLLIAGARVPDFVVVPTEAFSAHLEAHGLREKLEKILAEIKEAGLKEATSQESQIQSLDRRAAELRAVIEQTAMQEGLRKEIAESLSRYEGDLFAVRSSMVGEDSGSRSFAGQLDTYLYQRVQDVAGAVVRCWASCFTARALVYRARHGQGAELPKMGVVIQRMIAGHVSGVMFTKDPVSGKEDRSLISACWGIGDGVVSGRCDCDEFVMSHQGEELSCKITDKDIQITQDPSGAPGTQELPVPDAERNIRCLTLAEVIQLTQEGLRLAKALSEPLDIEWTISKEGLFILQARPITATGAGLAGQALQLNEDGPLVVWDNSNIQESYCGVTTPLTFSFARGAYANVYEQVMRIGRLPETEIASYRPVLQNLLGLLMGRVYYNINNWYWMLQHLPSFQRNKQDMEKMMGLDSPVDFITDEKPGILAKVRKLPRLFAIGMHMLYRFARMEKEVLFFTQHFEAGYRRVDRSRFATATFSELMQLLKQVREELMGHWHTPLINDIYVMMSSGRLRRLVERAVGEEAAPSLISNLMGGEEGIESTEPTRQVLRMSQLIRGKQALRDAFASPHFDLAEVRKAHPDFAAVFDSYIEKYGDRCMGELKLETVSLREDPSFLVRLLRGYVDRGDLDAEAIAEKEKRMRADAEARLRQVLSASAFKRAQKVLKAARLSVKYRENMRLMRTRLFGLVRDLYRAIGQRMAAASKLDLPRDVFYLTTDEIESYHQGTSVSTDTATLARTRKAEYAAYHKLDLPHRITTRGPVYQGNVLGKPIEEPIAASGILRLRGTACYPGVVEAPARVILNPADDLSLSGKILVTLRTDPGWAPLFPLARGILVERGSTLSHSAILARELGIPAVVGVPDLLRQVRDGDPLRLDGATGIIEGLEEK